jgi:hypothetical protein
MFNRIKKTREAINKNDATQVKKIVNKKKYREACALAIASDAPDALRTLLEKGKKFFLTVSTESDDRQAARELINAACAVPHPLPLLKVLYDINKTTKCGRLGTEEFLTKDMPTELIQSILTEKPEFFDHCVKNIGLVSPDKQKLGSILDCTSKAPNTQPTLDHALVQVATTGDTEKAELLLEHHANPNHRNGKALLCAGDGGHQSMVDLLLPHIKPALCSDIATLLERSQYDVPQAIISSIKSSAQKQPATQQPQETADGFKAINAHMLEETNTLSDGSRLKYVFNFSAGLLVILHQTGNDVPAGVSREKLDNLDPDYVQERREILDGLNGPKKIQRFRSPAPLTLT